MITADGCDSIIQTVLTFELIEVEFEFTDLGDNRFAFQNTTTGTRDFLWDFGDGNTSTEENPTHQYSTFGTFEVILTAINSSGEAVSMTLIINVVNANQLLEFATFEIYPNPTSGNLSVNLEYRDCAGALLGRILDVSGRALTTFQIDCFERTEHVLDLNHLEHGIYILELSDKNRLAAGSRIFLIQD